MTLPNGYDEQEIRRWKDSAGPDLLLGVVYVDVLLEALDAERAVPLIEYMQGAFGDAEGPHRQWLRDVRGEEG